MKVVNEFSQKDGKDFISRNFPTELQEVYEIIEIINLQQFKTKNGKGSR